jgi:hypothetical protein
MTGPRALDAGTSFAPGRRMKCSHAVRTSLRVAATALAIHGSASSQLIAHYSSEGGGERIAALGDLNGDGRADFVVPIDYGVSALSGVDHTELWHIDIDGVGPSTGYAMASAGDVDGDHTADLVVGTVINGLVRVYSGATQAILYQWQAPIPDIAFGTCVAAAGDIDSDGHGDVIVGTQSGKAYVYSGADGHLVYAPYQVIPGDHFGELVGGAGDVDGDGFDDFMISAHAFPNT